MKNASQSLLEPYFLYWDALLRLPVIGLDEATGIWQRLMVRRLPICLPPSGWKKWPNQGKINGS